VLVIGVIGLLGLIFEWDENKNKANQKKHGISFNEAISVFSDENAVIIADTDHSEQEERFVILGLSQKPRLLIVCHCYRENDALIRIISARKANKKESDFYGGAI